MSWVFKKHYTVDEARALLPEVQMWLHDLAILRDRLNTFDENIGKALGLGDDLGGEMISTYVRTLGAVKELLTRFKRSEIQIKDLERGLIDFPAFVAGKEVFLCWQKGEATIEYWHDLDSGYSGRAPIE